MRTPADPVIAVLGSSVRDGEALPVLSSRLDAAAEQWRIAERRGLSPYIFCLGGIGTNGIEPEAPIMARRLVDLGVPRSRIIEESYSRSTEENLHHLHAILLDPGYPHKWAGLPGSEVPDVRELTRQAPPPRMPLMIVTSRFHLPRTLILARHIGFDPHSVGSRARLRDRAVSIPREIGALVTWIIRTLRGTVA